MIEVASTQSKLEDLLLAEGLISEEILRRAKGLCARKKISLPEALLRLEAIAPKELLDILAQVHDVPAVELDGSVGDPLVLDLVPAKAARQLKIFPLYRVGNQLTAAMADPYNLVNIDRLRFLTGLEVLPAVALQSHIDRAIGEAYGAHDADLAEELTFEVASEGRGPKDLERLSENESHPIVRLVNLILVRALRQQATDVHLEPYRESLNVRLRIDGMLQALPYTIPSTLAPTIIGRIKVLAGLDISDQRRPHDGRVRLRYEGRDVDIRVSTLPSQHGEKAVLRLLDKQKTNLDLDALSMLSSVRSRWRNLMERREGILLVTGPTGSGKSSTLYATLRALQDPHLNIMTLEDPVEYELEGATQTQVCAKAGLTFASGLRSILRQDPDIVMVGEIRDGETASIAMQAATTGHLVLSTMHTNDAPSAITRLIDLGVPPYLIASSVLGVLAQRLVRRVCQNCVEEVDATESEALYLLPRLDKEGLRLEEARGCSECEGRGYTGRLAVHELVVMTPELRRLVSSAPDTEAIARQAERDGFIRMWEDGMCKVAQGKTTVRELSRWVTASPRTSGVDPVAPHYLSAAPKSRSGKPTVRLAPVVTAKR